MDQLKESQKYPCPRCLVEAGQPCIQKSGAPYVGYAHKARLKIVRQARNP